MDSMNEFSIYRTKSDDMWEVTFPNASGMKNKLLRLAEQFPDEVKKLIENKDGSVTAYIPLKWVKIGRPRYVEMTDEQKEIARKHAMYAREVKKSRH